VRASGRTAAAEVLVEPSDHDPRPLLHEVERALDDPLAEELRLVDPDDVEARGAFPKLRRAGDRDGSHPCARMADDVGLVVAVVDSRLEDDDPLPGDLGAPQPSDHLLALPAEHRTADDLEPAASLRGDPDHRRDPSEGPGHSSLRARPLLAARTTEEVALKPCYTLARAAA
jgi:hypothetical protein